MSNILRSLGIEIDLSGDADAELRDWIKGMKEARSGAEGFAGSINDFEKEFIDAAKQIGMGKKELIEFQKVQKQNKEIDAFAGKFGLQASEIRKLAEEAKNAEKQMSTLKGVMGGLAAIGIGSAVKGIGSEMTGLAMKAKARRSSLRLCLRVQQRRKIPSIC